MHKKLFQFKTRTGRIFVFVLNTETNIAIGQGYYRESSGEKIKDTDKDVRPSAEQERQWAKMTFKNYEEEEITNTNLFNSIYHLFQSHFGIQKGNANGKTNRYAAEVKGHKNKPASDRPFEILSTLLDNKK